MLKPIEAHRATRSETYRVAVLCSQRAPGLDYLLDRDGNRGTLYQLVCCVTTDPGCAEIDALDRADVPVVVHDIHRFYGDRQRPIGDLETRRDFDRATLAILDYFKPDMIALSGYLFILTGPMLEAYPGRIANIHHADLCLTDRAGRPRYPGLRAVREAIFAGERETRSTVHQVTEEVDRGPALVRSWAFPVHPLVEEARAWGATDILKAYAYAHREWMMKASWGPLLARTVEAFARDEIARTMDHRIAVAGRPAPIDLERPRLSVHIEPGPPPLRLATGA